MFWGFVKNGFRIFCLIIALFVIGISIGLLSGLSESPVINIILTTLMSVISVLVLISSGINPVGHKIFDSKRISYIPYISCLIVLGICVGSIGGLIIRNNQLLGIYPQLYLKQFNIITQEDSVTSSEFLKRVEMKQTLISKKVNSDMFKETGLQSKQEFTDTQRIIVEYYNEGDYDYVLNLLCLSGINKACETSVDDTLAVKELVATFSNNHY